jgi:L-fuconolactonase
MVIDSHVHFWKYNNKELPWIDRNMKILQKDYLPSDIELTLKRNNVDGCIAVQAAPSELETRFLAELANTHTYIKGVVGWADLRAGDVEKKLSELKQYPAVVGIRHIVQDEPDDFLYDEKFRSGIALLKNFGFTYDILIYPRQLKAAVDFVQSFPDQTFIIDHCAKPDVKNKEIDNWKKGITDLAVYPNVSCKLSGLITEAAWKNWSPADFYPYLDVVYQAFGIQRLIFGSDWPVMLLSGLYVQWKSLLEKYMERMLPEDREQVFGLNALRIYNINS